jgi:hypothetical protein
MLKVISTIFVISLVAGCAAEVIRSPEEFNVSSQSIQIEMTKLTTIEAAPGNGKQLFTGSRWQSVGNVKQGQVFKPVGTVFSIQSANSHEAYLVINNKNLVGFYLPGDRAWSALPAPLALEFKTVQ